MIIDKSKITIRPEKTKEYETVNNLIYTAFSEQHGKETGNFISKRCFARIPNARNYENACGVCIKYGKRNGIWSDIPWRKSCIVWKIWI